MIYLNSDNFRTEVEEYNGLVLIDFYADWCGPCRMLAPVFEELAGENPDVKFCKVNVDEQPQLARQFNVTNIPMVAFVKDNTFADLSVGFVPKEKLQKLIEVNK